MCPPNKIVKEVASEIVEAMKQSKHKQIKNIIAKYSKKGYIVYFKSLTPKKFSDIKVIDSLPREALIKSDKGAYLGVVVFVPGIRCKTITSKYQLTLPGSSDCRLRNKTMELNNNMCLNAAIYMTDYGIYDKNMHYLCMYLKKKENGLEIN